jgi:diaminohydroxyphosphoribosylaminopyrimidine deaminase/5-amino-6-(5-phosphoribosylamino)uracil reductase
VSRRAQADNRSDERRSQAHLERAFVLAASHHPHPNPRVGAVIVDANGVVAGEGGHVAPGQPHAEVVALAAAGSRASGGTAYVTLEPCDHHGRTPPCTDALIAAGIRRVVVAVGDPDPRVAGRGLSRLCAAGIEVVSDVDAARAESLDPGYFHHRRTGRPFITLKLAATLDGQTAAADGTSQWITSEAARHDAHLLRAQSDAIVVGAGTLRADDPQLDVRVEGKAHRNPRPVVIAGRAALPPAAKLYARRPIIYRPDVLGDEPESAEVVTLPGIGGVDLEAAVKDLGGRGMLDVLVEGGPRLAGELLRSGVVDRVIVYLAATLAGGSGYPMFGGTWDTLGDATLLDIVDVAKVGPDIRVTGVPREAA